MLPRLSSCPRVAPPVVRRLWLMHLPAWRLHLVKQLGPELGNDLPELRRAFHHVGAEQKVVDLVEVIHLDFDGLCRLIHLLDHAALGNCSLRKCFKADFPFLVASDMVAKYSFECLMAFV